MKGYRYVPKKLFTKTGSGKALAHGSEFANPRPVLWHVSCFSVLKNSYCPSFQETGNR